MRAWSTLVVSMLIAASPALAEDDPADLFETRVRPVLAENCWKCHGEAKQFAGLRLDSRAAALAGGDNGPALTPGDPDDSLIIAAVRHEGGELKMPPKGKLGDDAVEALSQWVRMGAPWPESAAAGGTGSAATHWAFQPVRKPRSPAVAQPAMVDDPIDAFVLEKLEAAGLGLSPEADKRSLLRRVTFDLTGLPPTPREIDEFLADEAPGAFERVVDRLLASPRYGERWARHWLDVARYADTKGYVFQEERRYPFAYTYRDWVTRALNDDLPYDQFLIRQLAADRLPAGEDNRDLAAMGFLTVGRRFLNVNEDIIDDRIDVTTRGMLGLTVTCARCHDHKYDPIPAEDYYSLYGIFASSEEPKELPLIGRASDSATHAEYEKNRTERRQAVDSYTASKRDELREDLRANVASYVKAAVDLERNPRHPKLDDRARTDKLRPETLRFVATRLKDQDDAAETAGEPDKARAWLDADHGPLAIADTDLKRLLNRADRNRLRELERKLAEVDVNDPTAPPRAMVLVDRSQLYDPYVFIRGNINRHGASIPRRFLRVLSEPSRPVYDQSSGRLELACAIASGSNPLTARVMVNRIWMHHFDSPLVATPSDFGLRSEPPTHPELLDWLAATFVENGWSIKAMHRLIVLSRTYRQQSAGHEPGQMRDPQNLLLWRQNRRRLEFEALRDGVLAVSGRLEPSMGGRPVALDNPASSTRRTLYAFVDRQNLDGVFRTFDLASPDASTPRRFITTVPQQALFLMNHPFLAEAARHLVAQAGLAGAASDDDRIGRISVRLFGRPAEPRELELGRAFVASRGEAPGGSGLGAWESYVQVLLMSNEFSYID